MCNNLWFSQLVYSFTRFLLCAQSAYRPLRGLFFRQGFLWSYCVSCLHWGSQVDATGYEGLLWTQCCHLFCVVVLGLIGFNVSLHRSDRWVFGRNGRSGSLTDASADLPSFFFKDYRKKNTHTQKSLYNIYLFHTRLRSNYLLCDSTAVPQISIRMRKDMKKANEEKASAENYFRKQTKKCFTSIFNILLNWWVHSSHFSSPFGLMV